jgi:hypothetical protein
LKGEGVLLETRPSGPAVLSATTAATLYTDAQLKVFLQHDVENPGDWAIAQSAAIMAAGSPSLLSPGRGVLVELYDALPVPSYDTQIEKVL